MVMKKILTVGVVAAAAAVGATGAAVVKRAMPKTLVPSFPVTDGGVTPASAPDLAATFASAERVTKADVAIEFMRASAVNVEPLLHGTAYFPRMLADIEAAETSVHLLMYGYKPGDIGEKFREALTAKVAAGVDVRLAVDAIGSEVRFGSKGLFAQLVDAGIPIVMNKGMMPDVTGPLGSGARVGWNTEDIGAFDHRKMLIVDGRIAYVGGTGIEDHFNDERFYDVMARVEGPVVAQLEALFIAGYRHQGGPIPTDPATLARFFPAIPEPTSGAVPTTVLVNVPGTGHYPISEAITALIEHAERRIDIVNPYVADKPTIDRLVEAAERGVKVRIVIPGKPTPTYPAAAFRHNYPRLLDAGVTILAHPDMAHAKVLVADDRALVGGCNFDALSLYENWELDLLFEDAAVAQRVSDEIVGRFAAVATPVEVAEDPKTKAWDMLMDRISPLL
jgi:cardiolipin synthase A/B